MHVMRPLTKGHLSNKDRIVVSLLQGDYCNVYTMHQLWYFLDVVHVQLIKTYGAAGPRG